MLPQGEELEPARAKAEKMGIKQIFIEDVGGSALHASLDEE
jgi:argininosuccinate synthase